MATFVCEQAPFLTIKLAGVPVKFDNGQLVLSDDDVRLAEMRYHVKSATLMRYGVREMPSLAEADAIARRIRASLDRQSQAAAGPFSSRHAQQSAQEVNQAQMQVEVGKMEITDPAKAAELLQTLQMGTDDKDNPDFMPGEDQSAEMQRRREAFEASQKPAEPAGEGGQVKQATASAVHSLLRPSNTK